MDISGKLFCSSERSKNAGPTALTIKQSLRLKYQCQGGSIQVVQPCNALYGYDTLCQEVCAQTFKIETPLRCPFSKNCKIGPRGGKRRGRAASGGALSPELPRDAGVGPEPIRIVDPFSLVFSVLFEIGRLLDPKLSPRSEKVEARSQNEEMSDLKNGGKNTRARGSLTSRREKRDINPRKLWSDSCGARRLWGHSACCAPNFSEITTFSQKNGQDNLLRKLLSDFPPTRRMDRTRKTESPRV